MAHLRTLIAASIALLSSIGYAGTFTKVRDNVYDYTGTVDFTDLPQLKKLVNAAGDTFIVVQVDSYGGYFTAGLELGRYVREKNSKIHMITKQSYSAAAFWVVGDRSYDYYDTDSFLWFHLPYYVDGYSPEGGYMYIGYLTGAYMQEIFGNYDKTAKFMERLSIMRDSYGINGAIVWRKHIVEKYYNCYFDEDANFIMIEVFPF